LYGAGDQKIGLSYDAQLSTQAAKKKGAEIRQAYMAAIPGLEELVTAVKSKAESGYINLCDGRRCAVDGSHKALNYLLQGSAGIVAKQWMVHTQNVIDTCLIKAHQLAFIHDELQFECPPDYADTLSSALTISALTAGEHYNLRIPIEAEAKVGQTWADVH
jgi:DNA polymerase I-like protein with 3'-5' exonuclease and polymerase domains